MKGKIVKKIVILTFICVLTLLDVFIVSRQIVQAEGEENVEQEETKINIEQGVEKYFEVAENQILLQQKVDVILNKEDKVKTSENLVVNIPVINEYVPDSAIVLLNGNKLSDDTYFYDAQNRKIEIYISSESQIKGFDNKQNTYQIVYTYLNMQVQEKISVTLDTTVNANIKDEGELTSTNQQQVETEVKGSNISFTGAMTDAVYKGYLYQGTQFSTPYAEINRIEISNANNLEDVTISNISQQFIEEDKAINGITNEEEIIETENDVNQSLYYKLTRINKDDMLRILGENGKITIYNQNDEILVEFNKDTDTDEEGNIITDLGAEFSWTLPGQSNAQTGITENGVLSLGQVQITDVENADTITITETKAPEGYNGLEGDIVVEIQKGISNEDGNTYEVTNVELTEGEDKGAQVSLEGNTIIITVPNEKIQEFDLALRKFITKVDEGEVTTRIPEVSYNREENQITYNHTKDPVEVVTGNVVEYTIRVYNEGDMAGYASEITDDIPDGLRFLPENETNVEYRWVMYDEQGNVTENVEEAVEIRTDYLSKEQEETEGENLLQAFNPDEPIGEGNPDYRDVKIAFEVVEPNGSDRIIVNSAQISEDSDEEGNPVEDIDSTPDEWNEGEDDQDREYIKLTYFDLSLRKWVTEAIVIENGQQTVTQTGHTAEMDPEPVVKVELYRKDLNDVTVKFRYKIRVTNEGDIAGYAKEITDYVPEGLMFVAEDNPGWTDEGNNIISTRLLENTLLQPGESAEIEVVLTWINGEDNMGQMTNIAEISEDYNDKGVPDRDSTPDNQVEGEDDIDDAPVLLSIETGRAVMYFTLGFTVLGTLAGGLVLIKRFVL